MTPPVALPAHIRREQYQQRMMSHCSSAHSSVSQPSESVVMLDGTTYGVQVYSAQVTTQLHMPVTQYIPLQTMQRDFVSEESI